MELRPLYDRILVKRTEEKEQVKGGIIIPDSAKEKPQRGYVIAAGKGKRMESGQLVPLDVRDGEQILFAKYSGSEGKIDGAEFLTMREDEVLGIVDETKKGSKAA